MALRIIEGPIGSGKTYYAVNHLLKNYFNWNKEKEVWETVSETLIFTNIDGFKFGGSLDDAIKAAGGVHAFFSVPYQQEFLKGRPAVYIIDEAQGPFFFHRKFYSPEVFYFFQYHRHLGIDVYLITQDVLSLAKELQNLAEFHVKVKGRVKSMTGEFGYSFITGGESFKTFWLRPRSNIFALYKSHYNKESEKVPSAVRRYALFFVFFISFAALVLYFGMGYVFAPRLVQAKTQDASSKILVEPSQEPPQSLNINSPASPIPSAFPSVQGVPGGVALVEIQVLGLFKVENDYGWVSYRRVSSPAIVYRVTDYAFDLICRCNSIDRLRSGDYLSVDSRLLTS